MKYNNVEPGTGAARNLCSHSILAREQTIQVWVTKQKTITWIDRSKFQKFPGIFIRSEWKHKFIHLHPRFPVKFNLYIMHICFAANHANAFIYSQNRQKTTVKYKGNTQELFFFYEIGFLEIGYFKGIIPSEGRFFWHFL